MLSTEQGHIIKFTTLVEIKRKKSSFQIKRIEDIFFKKERLSLDSDIVHFKGLMITSQRCAF